MSWPALRRAMSRRSAVTPSRLNPSRAAPIERWQAFQTSELRVLEVLSSRLWEQINTKEAQLNLLRFRGPTT